LLETGSSKLETVCVKLHIALHHRFQLWQIPEWFPGRLLREFHQLEVVHLPGYERVMEEIADADIAISWSLRGEDHGSKETTLDPFHSRRCASTHDA